jgi:transcriptional regulator with XRE-family HTH domain
VEPGERSKELGAALAAARQVKGWSLRQAVREIRGVGHSRLHDFERGLHPHTGLPTQPSEGQLRRIAQVYGVPPEPLLRLAGYSAAGPLSDWEEELVLAARKLDDTERSKVIELVRSLAGASQGRSAP